MADNPKQNTAKGKGPPPPPPPIPGLMRPETEYGLFSRRRKRWDPRKASS